MSAIAQLVKTGAACRDCREIIHDGLATGRPRLCAECREAKREEAERPE